MRRSHLAALLGFGLLCAAPASAQSADSALARIDSLLAAGVLRDARAQLDRWFETHPQGPGLGISIDRSALEKFRSTTT